MKNHLFLIWNFIPSASPHIAKSTISRRLKKLRVPKALVIKYLTSGASVINCFISFVENVLDFFALYLSDFIYSNTCSLEYFDVHFMLNMLIATLVPWDLS